MAGKLVNPGTNYADAQRQVIYGLANLAPATPNVSPNRSSSGSSGGRRYSYGGGGGGGGAADTHAQAQMDYITKLFGSGAYKTNPETYDTFRGFVNKATTEDQAASKAAYDALDAYLAANQSNPFADAALMSSGGAGDAGYGAFQNVLKLLSGGQQAATQSAGRESQMARAFSTNEIGAADNAYLFNIAGQQAKDQQALDAEKRQGLAQLIQLISQGAAAPDLASLGIR
jgi:hypothetical protein